MREPYAFNPYAVHSDEYYSSDASFDKTKEFIVFLSEHHTNEDQDYPLDEDILIIEVKEGILIKSTSYDWSNLLTQIAKKPYDGAPNLKIIKQREWDNITRSTRNPINLFGDQKLVFWKIGF